MDANSGWGSRKEWMCDLGWKNSRVVKIALLPWLCIMLQSQWERLYSWDSSSSSLAVALIFFPPSLRLRAQIVWWRFSLIVADVTAPMRPTYGLISKAGELNLQPQRERVKSRWRNSVVELSTHATARSPLAQWAIAQPEAAVILRLVVLSCLRNRTQSAVAASVFYPCSWPLD